MDPSSKQAQRFHSMVKRQHNPAYMQATAYMMLEAIHYKMQKGTGEGNKE
jgi:hypothetical protein